jgi:NAD(P)-dependent dehydrogenase (short-subunit alcohol dehydrogenase family)
MEQTVARHGKLNILVNNAGIVDAYGQFGSVEAAGTQHLSPLSLPSLSASSSSRYDMM